MAGAVVVAISPLLRVVAGGTDRGEFAIGVVTVVVVVVAVAVGVRIIDRLQHPGVQTAPPVSRPPTTQSHRLKMTL